MCLERRIISVYDYKGAHRAVWEAEKNTGIWFSEIGKGDDQIGGIADAQ